MRKRVEYTNTTNDLNESLSARITDPLWMLARQWQVGELFGEDTGSVVSITVAIEEAPLTEAGPPGQRQPLDGRPVEALIEADHRPARAGQFKRAIQASGVFGRLLLAHGVAHLRGPLHDAFPLRLVTSGPDVALLQAMGAGAVDIEQLVRHGEAIPGISGPDRTALRQTIEAYQSAVSEEISAPTDGWKKGRLGYSGEVVAGDAVAELTLRDHPGGSLDWYDFDLGEHGAEGQGRAPSTATATQLRYPGMPSSRWWSFEDGDVRLGDLAHDELDAATLLVTGFASVLGDDWYLVPVPATINRVVRAQRVTLRDTFGDEHTATPFAADHWKMFQLTGQANGAPWLLLLPTPHAVVTGNPVEAVYWSRDEGLNMAWAQEDLHMEPSSGRSIPKQPSPARPDPTATTWVASVDVSPSWVPFVAETIQDDGSMALRRARMQSWDAASGPRSALLTPSRPYLLDEESLPAGALLVERRPHRVVGADGRSWTWMGLQSAAAPARIAPDLRHDAVLYPRT